jgi:hypothetical protein
MVTSELFVAGAVGAIAPEIVRLYEIRMDSNLRFSPFYFLISVAYVILGGYVASIFPGIDKPFWAGCVGAGLVLVVNKMVHIGGLLAEGASRLVGGPPKAGKSERGGFGRHDIEAGKPRRANLMDFIRKL